MQKIIPARLRPGDEIRVIAPASGIKIIGRECREIARRRFEEMGLAVSYGTNAVDENWDAGGSTTVEKRTADIAEDAYLMVDMAHIAGLVAAGVHPNPVPYCEFVTTTTHKTLRGPRGGLILCREEFAKQIDKAIFPGTQGGPLMHVIAAKAVCFGEALKPEFKEYGKKIVSNCKALADGLLKRGNKLVSGGTDNHVLLMDLRDTDVTGKELEARLDDCYITVNKNTIPGEPRSPFVTSGVRIGTAAVTTRGLNEEDMDKIAEYITLVLNDYENSKEKVRAGVEEICKKYPLYE